MKLMMSSLGGFVVVGCICVGAMLQTGCEEAEGLDGLTIDPSSATLTTNGQTVVFTVTGGITNRTLALPLSWSVSDGSLGQILNSSGYSATYQRNGDALGSNTITARDQYENEGYATVRQTRIGYSLELTASATSIEVGQAATITISTDSAQSPYAWELLSGPGTVTGSSGSKSAVYTSGVAGTAVIKATDVNGASGTIGMTVTDPADDGDSGGDDDGGGPAGG